MPPSIVFFGDLISQDGATGETTGASCDIEYDSDRIEVHTGHINKGQRVLLIDDLVATGGTLVLESS